MFNASCTHSVMTLHVLLFEREGTTVGNIMHHGNMADMGIEPGISTRLREVMAMCCIICVAHPS